MSEKFKNTYRIPSARLKNWDYGTNASYFITICTQDMHCFFGSVHDKQMQFSALGQMANEYWGEIANHFPYIELGNFQVMPNHIHGILIINKSNLPLEPKVVLKEDKTGGFAGENNPMLQDNISRIIRWYKGRCSFEMRKVDKNFNWQARFHDHIIRNSESFEKIQTYIVDNPALWEEDRFYRE